MKHLYFLLAILLFSACSKEETYGPLKLKDGQEVELIISHRYHSVGDEPLVMPHQTSPQLSLYDFTEREPGYSYRVKAKMSAYKGPQMQDGGPTDHLKFMEVISKEKYEGNESFDIELIRSYIPGGPQIMLFKEDGKYIFLDDIQLTYSDDEVEAQLEKIWKHQEERIENSKKQIATYPKWRSIRATVSHDPDNFGKAYLVQNVKFTEI